MDSTTNKRPEVSICCLVFKSKKYLDFMIKGIEKYTDNYELVIVANDATEELKQYMKDKNIKFYDFNNSDPNEYYLNRVYRAHDYSFRVAKGKIVVLYASDTYPSKDWLPNLLKHLTPNNVISSRLVESGKMKSGVHAISKDFGKNPDEFREEEFQKFAESIKEGKVGEWGLYGPIAMYKDTYIKNGGYPFGNLEIKTSISEKIILLPADSAFFMTLQTKGINLYTSFDSICYHIQEGEKDE